MNPMKIVSMKIKLNPRNFNAMPQNAMTSEHENL
jgi:hypothetical protein